MPQTDRFIAHGFLPFVGREEEMKKVLDFWQSVSEAQHLRVLLLVAEAGMGKSHLLEECLQTIRSERGAVVHVKLYPEATNTLASLVSRSVWNSPVGRSILRTQPEETLHEVVFALQRLCRLRPTLLVLEDVHLFPSESIPDLSRLFEGLVDETISVLCLSRPISYAAQSILERYLVESMKMEGLTRSDLEELWNKLFDSPPSKGVINALFAVTKGNGLAVRSGLRGALQNNAIVQGERSGQWHVNGTVPFFKNMLQRSVSLVVEGMIAHLDRKTRKTVEQLSSLGEVFAPETATQLDVDVEDALGQLVEQGILVETLHPVAPLAGVPVHESGEQVMVDSPSSTTPLLAFTHSLLHDYLASRAQIKGEQLLCVVGENYPLYSLHPLRLLGSVALSAEGSEHLIPPVIQRLTAIMKSLDRTPEWSNAADMVGPLNRLLEHLESHANVDERAKRLWRLQVQHYTLSTLRRSMHSPTWTAMHDRQLALSANPESPEELRFWMLAKSFSISRIMFDTDYAICQSIFEEVEALSSQFPEMKREVTYIYILHSIVQTASGHGDLALMRLVQEQLRRLLAVPDLPPRTYRMLCIRLLPIFLAVFETPEELQERKDSIARIEEYENEDDPHYGLLKVYFLLLIGQFEQAQTLSDDVIRRTYDRGFLINVFVVLGRQLVCAAGTGASLQDVLQKLQVLIESESSEMNHPVFAQTAAATLISVGLFLNQPDEMLAAVKELGFEFESLPSVSRSVIGLLKNDIGPLREAEPSTLVSHLYPSVRAVQTWRGVTELWFSDEENRHEEVLDRLHGLLEHPVLHLFDILTVRLTANLWRSLAGEECTAQLKEKLISATTTRLEWLYTRKIYAFMKPLIELLEELGVEQIPIEWEQKIADGHLQASHNGLENSEDKTQAVKISLLGTVRVAVPPEDYAPIRGVRIRTLLGLMVADCMIASPLSAEEFLAIVGGQESDPEHARKKKNMAVVRLREIIGHDAILTDGPTPQLNLNLVSVDLLELDVLVRRALEAVREGAFVRALPLIEEALDCYNGDVPFPAFYENFFEAARGDFEYRLRRTVLEIGRGMLGLGDGAGVEPILRKAFALLPGDEEIADTLGEVFEASGNRIEAERMRMKQG